MTNGVCTHTAMGYCSKLNGETHNSCCKFILYLLQSINVSYFFFTGLIDALPAEVIAKLLPQSTPALARLHSMLGIDTITVPKFLAAYVIPNYIRLPDMAQAQLLTYVMESWWVVQKGRTVQHMKPCAALVPFSYKLFCSKWQQWCTKLA